jgi:uncharacterized protein (TIGR02118 family)
MIKSISLLTRRPELTHEQFVHHWLEIHAPLAHAVPGMRRYVRTTFRKPAPGRTSQKPRSRSMASPRPDSTIARR